MPSHSITVNGKDISKAFANPFVDRDPSTGPLTPRELERAMRQALAMEQEAIATYEAIAENCADPNVRERLLSIAREEKVHTGELEALLQHLDPQEAAAHSEGQAEA
jgi:rubrerythrin